MAVENLKGSLVGTNVTASPAVNAEVSHAGGRVRAIMDKVEVTAAASATSTYSFGYIPTNAVICYDSKLYWDDLGTTAGTGDLGLFAVNGNITDTDNALISAFNFATSASNSGVVSDISKIGYYVWEHAGATSDPGGVCEIKVTLDAAASAGGTLALDLKYTID